MMTCHCKVWADRFSALMKLFSRCIDEMPMIAVEQLDLEDAGIDVRQPFGLIGMAFQIEAGNKGFITADNDHDQQVGDHHDVDQPENDQHDLGFAEVAASDRAMYKMAQFDHEQPAIDDLGNDQTEVQRCLNPATGKDYGFKIFDGGIHRIFAGWERQKFIMDTE